jgi:hypothetical protein
MLSEKDKNKKTIFKSENWLDIKYFLFLNLLEVFCDKGMFAQ